MTVYKNFALLYDELMKDAPYDEWVKFTNEILHDRNVNSILDLGCGTGEITIRLAEQGRQLYGVDMSAEMLAIAEQKRLQTSMNVTWIQQDIRTLQGFSNIDMCISYCDVINYIVSELDVKKVFSNVYDCLATDGLFIFDVHSMNHVKHNMINETFTYTDDNLAYIWHCSEGESAGEMYHDMTFFYKENSNLDVFHRIEESHHQRTYPVETYVELLKSVQFNEINVYSDFLIKNEFIEQNSERIFIIAKK